MISSCMETFSYVLPYSKVQMSKEALQPLLVYIAQLESACEMAVSVQIRLFDVYHLLRHIGTDSKVINWGWFKVDLKFKHGSR